MSVVAELEDIRKIINESFCLINETSSFQFLRNNSDNLNETFLEIEAQWPDKLRSEIIDKFVIAFVGSSSAGKTTLLNELFPDLSNRKLLHTESNDTTSQALRIQYHSDPVKQPIKVHSWSMDQLKHLFTQKSVQEKNQQDNVKILFKNDLIHIDGTDTTTTDKITKHYRFPLEFSLIPFKQPYHLSAEQSNDKKFVTIQHP